MDKLLLLDGHSILNRAFYGMPHMSSKSGLPTNAVYGFLAIMFKLIDSEQPTHMAVAFDTSAPTFRHDLYKEYKGKRSPAPDDFKAQVPMMKELLKLMGILVIEKPGIEADDIIGTFAKRGESKGMDVIIYSGDKDLLQLVTDRILVRIPKTSKGTTTEYDYHEKELMEEYGVTPKGFIDLKAIMGDSSDNYQGVEGIGEVGAKKLLAEYGDLDNLYAHVDEIKGKTGEKLVASKDNAYFCRKLATILTDADVETDFNLAQFGDIYTPEARERLTEWNISNFLNRFSTAEVRDDDRIDKILANITEIKSKKELTDMFARAVKEPVIGVNVLHDRSSDSNEEESGQMSLFASEENAGRMVVAVAFLNGTTYFADSKVTGYETIKDGLKEIYDKNVLIVTGDMKGYLHASDIDGFYSRDMSKHFFDVSIAAYVINPLKSEPAVKNIAQWYLNMYAPEYDLKLDKKVDVSASTRPVAFLSDYKHDDFVKSTSLDAALALSLTDVLKSSLEKDGELELYLDIELPTAYVLYTMEKIGMPMVVSELKAYGEELSKSIDEIEKKILDAAGETKETFNINSPKQLGELLFERMGLEGGKKTKTGYSTSAEVLEKLAVDNPICSDILEYRTLAKLKSTYVEGLSDACSSDGRIHSTFNQTVTATGRLSSNDPNLQNIPTRYELGRKLRKVFVAGEGRIFCDADYSQIELRLLAAFSKDPDLINAYRENEDIHRITASKVFHVPFDEVTDLMRRNAKAVNFGIVYGISSFGLSQDLSITREEAKQYIDDYFKTYPAIKEYLDGVKADAKEKGYSVTLFGRRRPIPELKDSNFMRRQFGERVAMNAPLQGSAADIMKIAMINVHDRLLKDGLQSRIVLQVHDELLIETLINEKDAVLNILREEMESAADLPVKLEVSESSGENWYEAK